MSKALALAPNSRPNQEQYIEHSFHYPSAPPKDEVARFPNAGLGLDIPTLDHTRVRRLLPLHIAEFDLQRIRQPCGRGKGAPRHTEPRP